MGLVPSLYSFSASTPAVSAQVNSNFTNLRDVVNTYAVLTDVARTITAIQTFSATPVFGAGITVSAGGAAIVGASSIAGDLAITGTTTHTGTFDATTLKQGGLGMVSGTGTSGKLARWTGTGAQGDGSLADDGTYVSHAAQPRCVLVRTTGQAITTGTTAAMTFSAADVVDVGAMHDPLSNNSRVTIPAGAGGLYLFLANVAGSGTSGTGALTVDLRVDGTTVQLGTARPSLPIATGVSFETSLALPLVLAAGQYVELLLVTTTGEISVQGSLSAIRLW